ncbi:unnamed protein product, partial [Mycena citricolor]
VIVLVMTHALHWQVRDAVCRVVPVFRDSSTASLTVLILWFSFRHLIVSFL